MRRKRILPAVLLCAGLLLANVARVDAQTAESKDAGSGLDKLARKVGLSMLPAVPSLDGLIRPEKMGLLGDIRTLVRDNVANVGSGNEATVDVLSGNEADLRAEVSILSGLTVHLNITVQIGGEKKGQAKARKQRGKSKRAGKKRKR